MRFCKLENLFLSWAALGFLVLKKKAVVGKIKFGSCLQKMF